MENLEEERVRDLPKVACQLSYGQGSTFDKEVEEFLAVAMPLVCLLYVASSPEAAPGFAHSDQQQEHLAHEKANKDAKAHPAITQLPWAKSWCKV